MSIEINSHKQTLNVDEVLLSGSSFQITPENIDIFYEGMQNAKKRKQCSVCGLDNREIINVVGGDGKSREREVVVGGKKCEATNRGTTIVTVFKYIGPSKEEVVTTQEVDRPMWACTEFIKRVYPVIIEKP